ncbi:Rab proteins geranylgeranyltransferase component A 2 [Trichinella pseudospiralis]|uniref:Rab proteins geranylgeranyltransferase component A n=1 Tax=Trichinella pseudospiralis TaxID=6337 RepID=A0A0V1E6R7_TRIPS|nr:Rab proteins geranylgeranyltransferase component A 2 [Trichinella pseudospiralis]KRZ27651.1 Rab proteins geranylgeranyltransferase component A 2 [Trichinella pseudospiralis]
MQEDELPDRFSVILLGTGFSESILSAACSTAGFSVLHIDRQVDLLYFSVNCDNYYIVYDFFNMYAEFYICFFSSDVYGGNLATFDLDHLIKWLHNGGILSNSEEEMQAPDLAGFINEDERLFPIGDRQQIGKTIFNVKYEWHIPGKEEKVIEGVEVKNIDEIAKPIDRDYLKENNHRFNIDTNPRVVYANGSLVKLLLRSECAPYLEFKCIDRLFTYFQDELRTVPCSRTEVFASREIEKMDKRLLMQFLSFCFQFEKFPEQWTEFENRPAVEFMEYKKLPPLVQHHLLQALALGTSQTTTKQFLQRLHRFIQGVGRFGTSPYLWTIHGSGELPQAFCRCAAVNGAVYCLRRPVRAWIFNKQCKAVVAVVIGNQRVDCDFLVTDRSYIPEELWPAELEEDDHIARAILITDKTLRVSKSQLKPVENVSMLAFCTEANENPILLFDAASGVCASPKGTSVVNIMSPVSCNDAREQLQPTVQRLFSTASSGNSDADNNEKPRLIFSAYFTQKVAKSDVDLAKKKLFDNVIVTSLPSYNVDLDDVVDETEKLFKILWNDMPFFPPKKSDTSVEEMEE